jgi:hypothetical protein
MLNLMNKWVRLHSLMVMVGVLILGAVVLGEKQLQRQTYLEPGLWSLSNFGQVLVATIANRKTFTWNAGDAARLTTRASTTTSGFEQLITQQQLGLL